MKLSLQEINILDNAKDFLVYASELPKNRMSDLQKILHWDETINSVVFHMYVTKDGDSICDLSIFDGDGGRQDNIKATNEENNLVNDYLCTIKEYCDYFNIGGHYDKIC